ncbi:glycosyltransferase family protein [Mycolicibacterium stellerae]|uniref:hypothetical protein n=1 Tax=Mycolicibacterium stellerae TaxID=2358193 RepID=UPI001F20664A|nr:hypothetical protein [Mycolicibacterium stellerae]
MLVTAALHPESDSPREYEVELLGRPVPTAGWLPFLAAFDDARRFQPDVVVTEFLRDPRWRAFGQLAPRVRLLHDATPHDPTHRAPWWNRLFFERWDAKAYATVVFSNYVANRIAPTSTAGHPVYLAPLTSDLEASLVPEFVAAEKRRNFLLIGRQRPYKNHGVVFAAWEAHTQRSCWRGDELVLFGDGEITQPLPPHARWHRGSYLYREVIAELAASKGSIIHSRAASQSGVQVLSLQLGVPTLVSSAGALPEYQPPGMSITGIDDIEGLAVAIDALADTAQLDIQSKMALEHYRSHYDSAIAARRLLEIFDDVTKRARGDNINE